MTDNLITLDKEYQTRDGRPARVHVTDLGGGNGGKSVLATYQLDGATWVSIEYFANGQVKPDEETHLDLIEKPNKHKLVLTARIEELEAAYIGQFDKREAVEAKLAKAVEALQTIKMRAMPHKDDDDKDRKRQLVHIHSISNTALKELTGGKDE